MNTATASHPPAHRMNELERSQFRPGPTILVAATHGNAMLTRITAVLGPHELDALTYASLGDGTVRVILRLPSQGGAAHRIAAKLRRIVGVTSVVIDDEPAG